jgi:hypothetical protein
MDAAANLSSVSLSATSIMKLRQTYRERRPERELTWSVSCSSTMRRR